MSNWKITAWEYRKGASKRKKSARINPKDKDKTKCLKLLQVLPNKYK